MARIKEPEITVDALCERFDSSQAAIYAALKWGRSQGIFSDEAKQKLAELDTQRTERAKYYYRQLKAIRKVRRDAKRRLREFLADLPDPPAILEDRIAYEKRIDTLEARTFYKAHEEAQYERLIQQLEDSSAMLAGLKDAVQEEAGRGGLPTAFAWVVAPAPRSAGNNGNGNGHGSS